MLLGVERGVSKSGRARWMRRVAGVARRAGRVAGGRGLASVSGHAGVVGKAGVGGWQVARGVRAGRA